MSWSENHEVFVVVLFGTIMGAIGLVLITVLAPGVQATESTTYNESSVLPFSNYLYASYFQYTHSKDDRIVVPYVNSDGDLMVAYQTPPLGAVWEHVELAPYNYASSTGPWAAVGAVSTSNGSVCVAGILTETSWFNDVWLFTKFPSADWDDWDAEQIIEGGSTQYKGTMAINDTDRIMLAFQYGSSTPYYVRYEIFDFPNYTIESILDTGEQWDATATMGAFVACRVNESGRFHFFWRDNAGTSWYRDFDKSFAKVQLTSGSSYFVYDAVFMPNDMIFIAGMYLNYVYFASQSDYETTPTWTRASTITGTWYGYVISTIGGVGDDYEVRILSYRNDDDQGYTWSAAWNGTSVAWQNSEVESDMWDPNWLRLCGGNHQRWPRDEDNRLWAMQTDGWSLLVWDDDGATDEFRLFWNGSVWWGDLTTSAPAITTTSLTEGTFGESYSITLTKVNGTAPYVWTLLVGPSWLSINATTGELYGTPDNTGSWTVTVKLADSIPRYDTESWTLTVNPAESTIGGGSWATWWGPACLSSGVLAAIIIAIFAWGAFQIATRR